MVKDCYKKKSLERITCAILNWGTLICIWWIIIKWMYTNYPWLGFWKLKCLSWHSSIEIKKNSKNPVNLVYRKLNSLWTKYIKYLIISCCLGVLHVPNYWIRISGWFLVLLRTFFFVQIKLWVWKYNPLIDLNISCAAH